MSYLKKIHLSSWIIYIIFSVLCLYFLFSFAKYDLHLYTNEINHPIADIFFKYVTHLGDGILFAVLIVLFFIFDRKKVIYVAVCGILTLIVTHFLKKVVFKGTPRPIEVFGDEKLQLIEGVKMAHWNSFPSGHTITAFAIAVLIILLYHTHKKWHFVLMFLAILAGFSRVYLSQHFLVDVYVGSMIGIGVAFLTVFLCDKIVEKYGSKK